MSQLAHLGSEHGPTVSDWSAPAERAKTQEWWGCTDQMRQAGTQEVGRGHQEGIEEGRAGRQAGDWGRKGVCVWRIRGSRGGQRSEREAGAADVPLGPADADW